MNEEQRHVTDENIDRSASPDYGRIVGETRRHAALDPNHRLLTRPALMAAIAAGSLGVLVGAVGLSRRRGSRTARIKKAAMNAVRNRVLPGPGLLRTVLQVGVPIGIGFFKAFLEHEKTPDARKSDVNGERGAGGPDRENIKSVDNGKGRS